MKTKILCFFTIMLLITCLLPIGTAYLQNKEISNEITTQNNVIEPINHLGKIIVYHKIAGWKVEFEDTNDRDFYYPVVDGKVYLNFTVTGCHVLDDLAYGLLDYVQHKTGFICQVRGDYYTTYAKGNIALFCNVCDEPDCTDFDVVYTSTELELNKGENIKLWVGFGCWDVYQFFHAIIIPGAFIYPRNDWYDFWNWLYPGIVFPITVHGV